MRWGKLVPLVISLGLIVWLAQRTSLANLVRTIGSLPWKYLVPMTTALVIALYLWDALCMLTVFSAEGSRLSYLQMLKARGKSFLLGAWNQGLGQAAVAWEIARLQHSSVRAALTGSLILSWHEGLILSTAALAASPWVDYPGIAHVRGFCATLLAALLAAAWLLRLLPAKSWRWARERPWGAALAAWSYRRSLRLVLLRVVYFAMVGVYVPAALWLCGQGIGLATAAATVPLVLMASVLPSASGLGTRETALYLLLPSRQPDVIVAMGVLWSTGVIVVRLLIGLAWLWFDRSAVSGEAAPVQRQPLATVQVEKVL
jgi:hypothetical protein